MSDEQSNAPAPDEEGVVTQSFCIVVRHRPDVMDADGNPVAPEWDFRPHGPGIGPSDCLLMCAKGVEWVVLGQALAKHQEKERKIIPVGGGRNRVLKVN